MVKGFCFSLAVAAAGVIGSASAAVDRPLVEIWNEGVELYRAGDTNGAFTAMNELYTGMDARYKAKAAEVIAKMRYDESRHADNRNALVSLEEAALAAQTALRADPGDSRRQRNFTRATDGLLAMREAKRVNSLIEGAANSDPGALMHSALTEARLLMGEASHYLTNVAAVAVAKGDELCNRAQKLDDTWIVAREAIARSVTNETDAANIQARIDEARSRTALAARQLGDLDEAGYSSIADAEKDFNDFFKMLALPRPAMEEDLVAQSNAWQDVERVNDRDWQREALDYTRRFRAVFPAWAKAYEQAAQADTNKPPFTAETQGKIAALAIELEKRQLSCVEVSDPPAQEQSLAIIREILELLPDEQGGGNSSRQPETQSKESASKPQSDSGEGEDRNDSASAPEPEAGEGEDEEPKDGASEGDTGPERDEREIEAILKKAQERNDEHEAEKRARMRKAPLRPDERDW